MKIKQIKHYLTFENLEGANIKGTSYDYVTDFIIGNRFDLPKVGNLENLPDGKDFVGFSYGDPDGEIIEEFYFTAENINDTHIFYAHFKTYYVVSFEDEINDQTLTQKVYEGEKVEKPEDPINTHYIFQHWEDEAGREFDFETKIPSPFGIGIFLLRN